MNQQSRVADSQDFTEMETRTAQSRMIAVHQVVLVLGLVLTFVAYCGSIGYPFVYDDHGQILTNSFVHSWRFVPRYFTHHVWESVMPGAPSNYYRPIFLLWLRINNALFGLKPWGWHLTSILMHLVTTVCVYFLSLRIIRDRLTAAIAATIFGLHPVHVEAVVWISGVTEPLMGVLFLASLICYLKARQQDRNRPWLWTSVLLFAAALFTKETALMFPVLIFAYEWLFGQLTARAPSQPSYAQRVRYGIRCLWPYLPVVPVYLALRTIVLKGFSPAVAPLTASAVMLTAPSLLWFYLKRLVWPVRMSLVYNLPYVRDPGFLNLVLPCSGIAGAAFLLWAWARGPRGGASFASRSSESRVIAFAATCLLVPLLPVLNAYVLPTNDYVHDRYLYLPSLGFAMMAAILLRSLEIGQATGWRRWVAQTVLAAALAVLCVWDAAAESVVWSDDLLLYYRGMTIAPNSTLLTTNLGTALAERGHYSEAASIFHQVLSRDPDVWEANYNLGLIYYRLGRLKEAESYLRRAVHDDSNKPAAFLYLGLTQLKMGRVEEAAAAIHQAVRLNPHAYGVHFARGVVLRFEGDLTGALEEFRRELALNPEQQAAREQIEEIERRLHGR